MRQQSIYLGLGSNMGDRVRYLREAVARIGALVNITKISNLYVAAPLGYVRDDAFINAVLNGTTTLTPMELLKEMQEIERAMGRQPGVSYGPRPIDIDILFYGMTQIETISLTVPHPRMAQRAFVLKPLAEIAPTLMHPVLYYTITELLQDADDVEQVQLYAPSDQANSQRI